jgi:hypothetical protein
MLPSAENRVRSATKLAAKQPTEGPTIVLLLPSLFPKKLKNPALRMVAPRWSPLVPNQIQILMELS